MQIETVYQIQDITAEEKKNHLVIQGNFETSPSLRTPRQLIL